MTFFIACYNFFVDLQLLEFYLLLVFGPSIKDTQWSNVNALFCDASGARSPVGVQTLLSALAYSNCVGTGLLLGNDIERECCDETLSGLECQNIATSLARCSLNHRI